jgi:hypothetical protein
MGLATPTAFAESEPPLRSRTSTELVAAGHQALAVRCDVSDEADVAAMVSTTVSTFGRLDAPFNGAGVQSPATDAADESAGRFDPFNGINLRGVWAYMKHELRQMRAGLGCKGQLLLTGWSRGQPGGWPTGGALVEDSRPWRLEPERGTACDGRGPLGSRAEPTALPLRPDDGPWQARREHRTMSAFGRPSATARGITMLGVGPTHRTRRRPCPRSGRQIAGRPPRPGRAANGG